MNIDSILPLWALIAIALSIGMGVAGLGVWLAAQAIESVLRLWRRTLAAELRLRHLQRQQDMATLNAWIRDFFQQKEQTKEAQGRARQEQDLRKGIARGADQMLRREGLA